MFFFVEESLEIIKELARKPPSGPLFRTSRTKRGAGRGTANGWSGKQAATANGSAVVVG
ncbi:MAG: hypothetical protein ACRELG_23660 [Gemmataceae bacterium]